MITPFIMSTQFKKIAVHATLLIIEANRISVKFLYALISRMLLSPFYKISRAVFGRLIIKFYSWSIILKNKLKLNKKISLTGILTNNKTSRATIAFISIIITGANIMFNAGQTSAAYSFEGEDRPALFYLIQGGEFSEDEKLIVETFSESAVITPVEENYLKNLASVKAQPQVEMKSLEERVEETENIVEGGSSIVKPNIAKTKKIKRARKTIVYHAVRPGETVSTIAQNYDISASTILWENDLNAYSLIKPGDKLAILPVTGVSYTVSKGDTLEGISKKYKIEMEKITEFNNITNNGYLKIGQKIIIPDGSKKYTSPSYSSYSGLAALKNIIAPPSANAVSGNKMNWPTSGHRITQYYTWRHYAIDIAGKIGTPIYASDAGTVEFAGWGTGYGNQIVIDHGGGKKTRYAHNSKHFVRKGDVVEKGQTIAAVGSTGWSTGPHVHFEIIINGRKYNPLDYIK